MLEAIDDARSSIRLEMYIYHPSGPGERIRDGLVRACQRGVKVHVLVDALGSDTLTDGFWATLTMAGGEFRWFNPSQLQRMTFRDHRKLLVCDARMAIVGGFNVMPEIEGDGIARGWRDVAMWTDSALAVELAAAFDEMFAMADFRHPHFARLRRTPAKQTRHVPDARLLLSGPGRGRNPIKAALHQDLARAGDIRMAMAYFIPTWRIRRLIARSARRKGRVQLLLPAKSDVALAQLACRRIYGSLMRAGVEIYEYQPQVLHSKWILVDDAVYVGSANLDRRSLGINYELMVRLDNPAMVREAGERFEADLAHATRIDPGVWRKTRTFWMKLKEQWAWYVLVQLDAHIARWQLKNLGRH